MTEDPPIFTAWRTLNIPAEDVDKIQLSTRTVQAGLFFLTLTNASSASFFRLTVIYTRYVRGIIVFKASRFVTVSLYEPNWKVFMQRKYSEQVRYADLTDFVGRFDALKFESWLRGVIFNAMTVPHGSVWVSQTTNASFDLITS